MATPSTKGTPLAFIKDNGDDIDFAASIIWLGNQAAGTDATDEQIMNVLDALGVDQTPENVDSVRGKLDQ